MTSSKRFAGVALALSFMASAQTAVPEKDAAEIHAALDGMQSAWNHHDMKDFVSYMTEDVEWVNVVGMWWKGKAQVFKAHDALHKTMFKGRDLHPAESLAMREIAPGVVVVTMIVPMDGYTTSDGHVVPANRNLLTETFVQRDGRWLVAEGHNTVIDERAQAHDPGK
jgi:uncharacterized protein (TIGR02246 family)